MITGLNHITLAVGDVERSFQFYVETLGTKPLVRWSRGAYLLAGDLWLCLTLDERTRSSALPEYSHIAFSVREAEFNDASERIRTSGATIWKENESEGASLYFLDPDGQAGDPYRGLADPARGDERGSVGAEHSVFRLAGNSAVLTIGNSTPSPNSPTFPATGRGAGGVSAIRCPLVRSSRASSRSRLPDALLPREQFHSAPEFFRRADRAGLRRPANRCRSTYPLFLGPAEKLLPVSLHLVGVLAPRERTGSVTSASIAKTEPGAA